MNDPSFRSEQYGVAVRMAAALVATGLVLGATTYASMGAPDESVAERLRWLVLAEVIVALWLVAAIGNVARLRFVSVDDIAGSSAGAASQPVRDAQAILQNTLEQMALAIVANAAVAFTLPRPDPVLIALVGLFSIGRALFWFGYARGAAHRASGFALTFYPSACALLIAAVTWLVQALAGR